MEAHIPEAMRRDVQININPYDIIVNEPQTITPHNMSTDTQTPDLTAMTEEQLLAEMQRRKDAKGADREAYKELVQEAVPDVFKMLKETSEMIAASKTAAFESLIDLIDLKNKAYGVKANRQSHTFTAENGESITLGYRVTDGWDDTVGEGIAKVGEFIESLAKDESSAILVKTIQNLLKKDAKNNLKANRVVELLNMAEEFNDGLFTDGVQIIHAAYKPKKSVYFIEANYSDEIGGKCGVPLSISSVEFTKSLNINL